MMTFIVTAGPTREFLDPVRFLSNPSTGRMGFEVARAAALAGYRVNLIAGPVALRTPVGVFRTDVVSARDMEAAVVGEVRAAAGCDAVLVMTAAVADWRPESCAPVKLKKARMSASLALARNPDVLASVAAEVAAHPHSGRFVRMGFAAETGDVTAEAVRKCREKELDFIVANDVTEPGCGFAAATNRVTVFAAGGGVTPIGKMSKAAIARRLVAMCADRIRRQAVFQG